MFARLFKTRSLSSMMALPLAACGGEVEMEVQAPAMDDSQLGESEAAFSANWNYSWGDTKTSSVDIGTSVGRTCFLTGIGGHMRPIGAYLYSGGTYPAMAGVRKAANGNYELYVQPSAGKHLIVYARCVNSAAGRIEVKWTSGEQSYYGDKVIAAAATHRQCFLQEVKNLAVPLKDISEFHGAWTWKAGDPGTAQINLSNVSGVTCGLTGINGHFDAEYGDWNDAVSISTEGSQFQLNMANGKRGWAACVK